MKGSEEPNVLKQKEPMYGVYVGYDAERCGNIVKEQEITITGIRNPCGAGSCNTREEGKCNGTSYYVKEHHGGTICSCAIVLKKPSLDWILGLE